MNGRPVLVLLAGAIVAGLGCETPASDELNATDEAALRQALEIEMKAANAADASGWASVYTDDAIVLRPHGSAVEGREAIQQQADGSWKMAREISNSDLPLPTPAPPAPDR